MILDVKSPSPEQQATGRSAATWLEQIAATYRDRNLTAAPIWVLGYARARRVAGSPLPLAESRVPELCHIASTEETTPINPLLLVDAIRLTGSSDERVRRYLDKLSTSLHEVDARQELYPTALLLRAWCSQLGSGTAPELADWKKWSPPTIADLATAQSGLLAAMAHWVVGQAALGAALDDARAEMLASVMFSLCRRYELAPAAQLRCALAGLPVVTQLCTYADRFFALQRSSAGYYGHLNPFSELSTRDPQWIDVEFRLPITTMLLATLLLEESV